MKFRSKLILSIACLTVSPIASGLASTPVTCTTMTESDDTSSAPTDLRLELSGETDASNGRVISVYENDAEIATFAVPAEPLMTATNGSIAATYATHDFVLTMFVDDMEARTPVGEGFSAFRIVGREPASFTVDCQIEEIPEIDVSAIELQ